MNIAALKTENNGTLPAYAWPGGYPMYYLDHDCGVICPKCANDDDWTDKDIIAYDVHYEGAPLQCENCNALIESAYGDPEADAE